VQTVLRTVDLESVALCDVRRKTKRLFLDRGAEAGVQYVHGEAREHSREFVLIQAWNQIASRAGCKRVAWDSIHGAGG
jgi:hypothetical protein